MFNWSRYISKKFKSKFTYNGRGIAFDGEGSSSFDNDFAKNLVIFGVDNSSSSHTDNQKNNFLGQGSTRGVNDSTGEAEKKLVLTLVEQI